MYLGNVCSSVVSMTLRRISLLVLLAGISLAIAASAYAASIVGTASADTLRGTPKADVLTGKGGNDTLYGLAGNDRFFPGPGKDRVYCGSGVDRVQADRLDMVAKDCEIVTRPAISKPPVAPEPPPPPVVPVGSTRANPVPFGNVFPLGNGWTLKVESITPDAWGAIQARNQFNDPPASGGQFFIATVTVTNVNSSTTRFPDSDLRSVGSTNVPHTTYTNSCGVIPNSFLFEGGEAFPGGSLTRNVCWQVAATEVGTLQMFYEPLIGGSRIFFALR